MSGSTESETANVAHEDHGTVMAHINFQRDAVAFDKLKKAFGQTHQVLTSVAQYFQPCREVMMICNHPQSIIDLQRQITDLQMKHFLPPEFNHPKLVQRISTLNNNGAEAIQSPAAIRIDA